MQAFDASSMIHAWDSYPAQQFPPLWRWMASQIESGEFVTPQVAYEETERLAPDCAKWLRDRNMQRLSVSNEIAQEAFRIKNLLGIQDDKYLNGVGENDLLIIATASVEGLELVSDERRQNQLPDKRANMKIPAVCQMSEVAVPCLNFIMLIKQSGEIFES